MLRSSTSSTEQTDRKPGTRSLAEVPSNELIHLDSGRATIRRSPRRTLCSLPDLPQSLADRLWADPDRMIAEGTMLKNGGRCTVVRFEAEGRSWVLKRYNLRGLLHTIGHFVLESRARHCWRYGRQLRQIGILTPKPVAFLETGFGPLKMRSYLLMEYIAGTPLSDVLHDSSPDEPLLETAAAEFTSIWSELETHCISHGDTKARNFLVTDEGRVWLIDLDSMKQHRIGPLFDRARRRDWRRFMRNGQNGAGGWSQFEKLLRRTLHIGQPVRKGNAGQQNGSAIWVNPDFQNTLARNGLDNFAAMMSHQDGHLMRRRDDRENWWLDLNDALGNRQRFFLKRHGFRTLSTWLRKFLKLGAGKTPGRMEAELAVRLNNQGIATMPVAAYGEQLESDGTLASFLLTRELTGFTQLDVFLPAKFEGKLPARRGQLRDLVNKVAEVSKRFHRLGYNHRDFYTCHFFVRERETGNFDVNLIDLQRVQKRRYLRRRWIVKDLAQLAYSSPRELIGCTERMRFIKRYLGVKKLRPKDKRLIRFVLFKESWMNYKLGPYR